MNKIKKPSKKLLFTLATLASIVAIPCDFASAQITIEIGGVTASSAEKGTTNNLNVSSGSRTSLSVANSTSFGASVNLNASPRITAFATSTLTPTTASVVSSIGNNADQTTVINIANLQSAGNSANEPDLKINEASGDVLIKGMTADVRLDVRTTGTAYDGTTTNPGGTVHNGPGEASFDVAVYPEQSGDPSTCTEDMRACNFIATDNLTSGNASASANLNTATNVDINATNFTTVFAQSF